MNYTRKDRAEFQPAYIGDWVIGYRSKICSRYEIISYTKGNSIRQPLTTLEMDVVEDTDMILARVTRG